MLRCCQLPSVPAGVCLLSRLTHLDVSRNQLVELPPGLSALGALRELVAEGNCFPRIPQVGPATPPRLRSSLAPYYLFLNLLMIGSLGFGSHCHGWRVISVPATVRCCAGRWWAVR